MHRRRGREDGKRIGKLSGSEIPPSQAVRLLDDLTTIIANACALIRAISPAAVVTRIKPDQSPVTAADEASETAILKGLSRVLPGIPVVSEESAGAAPIPNGEASFVIVDP